MISEEKIYTELLDLYYSSGREFYAEMAAMLGQQFEDIEHSFFTCEEGKWKMAASTIQSRDEREFLKNQADELKDPFPEYGFRFPEQRPKTRNHLVIPLLVKKKQLIALWVIESKVKERIPEREFTRISKLLTLFFQLSKAEKNWYLDADTGIPGRVYFMQVLKRLEKGGHSTIICVFRLPDYRKSIRINGFEETQRRCNEMIRQVKQLQLGNIYALSEDTIAVISLVKEEEAYARIQNMLDMNGIRLIPAVIRPEKEEDIFAVIENRITLCDQGETQGESDEEIGMEENKQQKELPLDDLLGFIQEGGV